LPYFNLDGSINCFARLKLFPAVSDEDGHKQKYWQPSGTAPGLYVPPLLNWATVAKNLRTTLVIAEGEKKAAAGCQAGLITAGVGGVWSWISTLDNGSRLVLPLLDDFQWPARPVLICPDSDAWREGKEQHILSGFFALAKDLQARGAFVQFVVLPDLHGAKTGLDDWLKEPGNTVEHAWPQLPRLALDHARFSVLTAWWQSWKEKQATLSAHKDRDQDAMELTESAGLYTVISVKHGVRFSFERLTEQRGGVIAEVTALLGARELLSGVDLGLKSDSGQTKLAGSLKRLAAAIPWKLLLQRACALVLKRHREGEPFVVLEPADSLHVPFIINPFIYSNHQTLWYAPGGSLKSYLALFVSLLTCHGQQHAGMSSIQAPVLYLDWELNQDTVAGRLKALRAGHPQLNQHTPHYHRCDLPLHQEVSQIASYVASHKIQLLIVDSAAMACGGDLNLPDAAIKLQRALRMIGCASLVLAHVSKSTPDGHERSAYGTVFFRELARNVWELERANDTSRLVLCQTKNNFARNHPPLGFEFNFLEGAVRVDPYDPAEEPAFEHKLPLASRIYNFLVEDGSLRAAYEIAEAVAAPLSSVKSTLSRYRRIKWQQIGENREAKWTVLRR